MTNTRSPDFSNKRAGWPVTGLTRTSLLEDSGEAFNNRCQRAGEYVLELRRLLLPGNVREEAGLLPHYRATNGRGTREISDYRFGRLKLCPDNVQMDTAASAIVEFLTQAHFFLGNFANIRLSSSSLMPLRSRSNKRTSRYISRLLLLSCSLFNRLVSVLADS